MLQLLTYFLSERPILPDLFFYFFEPRTRQGKTSLSGTFVIPWEYVPNY